jgi:hypothetical protein
LGSGKAARGSLVLEDGEVGADLIGVAQRKAAGLGITAHAAILAEYG